LWHIAVQYGAQHGWEILLAQRPIAKQAAEAQDINAGKKI
jgi:hypothetical protein